MLVTIHVNLNTPHQTRWANAWSQGFNAHGIDNRITTDVFKAGDVHVIYAPNYAYNHWLGKPNVLYGNRCWYGSKDEWQSLGWLHWTGARNFMADDKNGDRWARQSKRIGVELKPQHTGRRCVLFGDYKEERARYLRIMGQCIDQGWEVAYRPHPKARDWEQLPYNNIRHEPLEDVLNDCKLAIGFTSSVLVTAALHGVPIACFSMANPVYEIAAHKVTDYGMTGRRNWVYRLAWSQWHLSELQNGSFWNHFGSGVDHAMERNDSTDN